MPEGQGPAGVKGDQNHRQAIQAKKTEGFQDLLFGTFLYHPLPAVV